MFIRPELGGKVQDVYFSLHTVYLNVKLSNRSLKSFWVRISDHFNLLLFIIFFIFMYLFRDFVHKWIFRYDNGISLCTKYKCSANILNNREKVRMNT